jgi:hypothetical protein
MNAARVALVLFSMFIFRGAPGPDKFTCEHTKGKHGKDVIICLSPKQMRGFKA